MENLQAFSKLLPYLSHPLTLMGFTLFLFFGVHRLLIKSRLIRPLKSQDGSKVIYAILRYGFTIALIVIVFGFVTAAQSRKSDREAEARRMYEYAIAVRKGRGDAGLRESMEIFRKIGQEYSETSAARDALEQLRASEEVMKKLEEVRAKVRDAMIGRPPIKAEACPESVTSNLCKRLETQDFRVALEGTLARCSFDQARSIVNKCADLRK